VENGDARSIHEEHARMGALLDRVERVLGARAHAPETPVTAVALELAATLGVHLFADPAHGPFAASDALRSEHAELRIMLAALVRTIHARTGAKRNGQVAVQLRDLVDLLRVHLRREHALLLAAAEPEPSARRRKGTAP
jgi:hypothetical protein